MFGTLRGALAGRKIAFDRDTFTAAVEGKIVGHGKTIRIRSIHVHYDVTVPADALEATERALAAHPQGRPAHESVKGAIEVTWDARVRAGASAALNANVARGSARNTTSSSTRRTSSHAPPASRSTVSARSAPA